MNKDELRMQMADLNLEILSDLKKDLANEKSKPSIERDESFISELEDLIAQTEEEVLSESRARSLDKSLKMLDEYKTPRKIKLFKYLSVAAAVLIVFWGLNTASMKVFGQNMFSAAYQLTKGGITISTDDPSNSDELTVSPSDPYGMKAKCAEYGFFPDTPSYIPDGFELYNLIEGTEDNLDVIIFMFRNENMILNFYFTNYRTNKETSPISLPSDTYNVEEEIINGNTFYILKEDNQFTAIFTKNGIKCRIFTENVDYDECISIIKSI
ncbi:MAG: DUF4367 domain-containing protein [Lachnospiraceae bacterium]|nr:DUF4367 domain-containing protein [Lachnospiraceae bacterium]